MNLKTQRALDHFIGVPICALLSLIERMFRRRMGVVAPEKILVILLSEMGSLVLAQPMFDHLKEKYPRASIHVMLFARNREVLDLLGAVPSANVLTIEDRSLVRFAKDCLRATIKARALGFDTTIDCELFSRISSILSYLSGARTRVGFHRHTQEGLYRGTFINRPVLYNPYRHMTLQFLTMAVALDSESEPLAKELPEVRGNRPQTLVFGKDERDSVVERFHRDFPAANGKHLVLVYPSGGILPIRAWPLESYKALCAALVSEGHAVAIIGLTADRPLGQALVAHCGSSSCMDLTGWTRSLRELLALFHHAELLISNDGGPAQFAALTPIPSIVLFGPETPVLYRSLSESSHCLYLQLPCSPCLTAYNHRNSPCDGDNQCLKQIAPEKILAKVREILRVRDVPDPSL